MDDRSEPSGTSTTVMSNAPPAYQQPFIQRGLAEAEKYYDTPRSYYEGSTVVPFSTRTNEAMAGIDARARAGSPLVTNAQNLTADTMAGNFLNASSNPYLSNAMDAATRPMREAFRQDVMPSIDAAFSSAGRYGSGLQANAQDRAADTYLQNVGDMTSRMAFSNYGDERGRQIAAANAAPTMAELDYLGLERLGQLGAVDEAFAGSALQEDIDRYNFAQEEGRVRLGEFLPQVTGGQFSQQTTAEPLYNNDAATYLGYGATGANILGGLFGGGSDSAYQGLKGLF